MHIILLLDRKKYSDNTIFQNINILAFLSGFPIANPFEPKSKLLKPNRTKTNLA